MRASSILAVLCVSFLFAGCFPPLTEAESGPALEFRVYIVELSGPLPGDCVGALESTGAEVLAYLPPSSFLIAVPASPGLMVPSLSISSISALESAAKLSPLLPQAERLEGGELLFTALFAGSRSGMERSLEKAGARPLAWSAGSVKFSAGPDAPERLSCLPQVFWIEPSFRPEPLNDKATRTLGARQGADGSFLNDGASLWSYDSGTFVGLSGAGVNVSITDSGIDGTHPAFDGRKVGYRDYGTGSAWQDRDAYGSEGHGTMCAGIVAGSGAWRTSDPSGAPGKYAGMAPGAGLVGQAIFTGWSTTTQRCRDALDLGAQVTSNSWGAGSFYGQYISECAEYDSAVRDADPNQAGDQPLMVVFSAGNSGPTSITVSPPATSKNVISVGAIGNDKSGVYGYVTSDQIVSFSSRGPCNDGRIKPDVLAMGVDAYTTSALYNAFKSYLGTVPDDPDSSSYFIGGGTSSACPYVAGASALVVAYWRANHGANPSPALNKALLINGAQPLPGFTYPGNDQGWGRIDVARSLLSKPERTILAYDQQISLSSGETSWKVINVGSAGEFKVTLVWTDEPGSPQASKALVNDLDLVITDPDGNIYQGNQFVNGQSVPGGSADVKNNVEGFLLKAPKAGKYRVNVTGSSVPFGPQDFALVLSGVIKEITADLSAESASFSPPSPLEGDPVGMDFTVRNTGRIQLENAPYAVAVDGVTVQEGTVPLLTPGASTFVRASWTAVRGPHSLSVTMDPQGVLDELSEQNNRASTTVTVLHHGVSATASPEKVLLDPGSAFLFDAEVRNTGTAPDTILLELSSDQPSWTATLSVPSLQLSAGEVGRVQLGMACPPLALADETAQLRLKAVSRGNSTYISEARVQAVTRQVYSVALSADRALAEVLPGEEAAFNLTVRNGGNGWDTIGLDAQGAPEDWEVSLSMQSLALAARTDSAQELRITPPAKCLAGNQSLVRVSASSLGALSSNVDLTVSVKQFFSVGVAFLLLDRTSLPGNRLEAVYFIHNEGNGPDLVSIDLLVPEGWSAELNRSVQLAGYQEPLGQGLVMNVPAGELAGDYGLALTVTSQGGKVVRENFMITILQVFAVAASGSPLVEVIYPGEEARFSVSISNLGNGNDSFTIAPEGLPEPLAVRELGGPVPLGPGTSASARVRLEASALAPGGELRLTFRAVSRGSPVTAGRAVIVLRVVELPRPVLEDVFEVPFAPSVFLDGYEVCGAIFAVGAVSITAIVLAASRRRVRASWSIPERPSGFKY